MIRNLLKRFLNWKYKRALDYVMDQHRRYLFDPGFAGHQLSFKGRTFEGVDFAECEFYSTSFNRARFLQCPHVGVRMDNCTFDGAHLLKSSMISAKFNHCDMNGVDWTGTFSGEMKGRVERLAARTGTPEDFDNMSVVATGAGTAKLQLDDHPHMPRIRNTKKNRKK